MFGPAECRPESLQVFYMKLLIQKLNQWFEKLLAIYKGKTIRQMILLSAFMLAGFFWPLAGLAVFLFGQVRRRYQSYGKLAMLGAVLNVVMYLIQIFLKLAAQAG